jgi:hypothetical protein
MSWVFIPGVIRGLPGNANPYPLVLRGEGADAGRVCYEWRDANEIVIPATTECKWGPGFSIDGSSSVNLFPQNGLRLSPLSQGWGTTSRWWQGSGNSPLRLWLSTGFGWVLSSECPAGCEPTEAWDSQADPDGDGDPEGAWTGDEFWTCNALPAWGSTATFIPRGRIKTTGSNKTIAWRWPRWKRNGFIGTLPPRYDDIFGEYEAEDGADESITPIVGRPSWGNGYIIRSVRKDVKTGIWTYGWGFSHTKWSSTAQKYIIGAYGAPGGWWEGDEPEPGQTATFEFTYQTPDPIPEGWEAPEGEDLEFEWDGHIRGDARKENAFISEVARWV